MPVIIDHTEDMLVEHLESLAAQPGNWGLAILHGSQLDSAYQRMLFSTESQLLLMNLSHNAGMVIYSCFDHDIVFLFQGSREENWPLLRNIFYELLPHMAPEDVDCASLFTVFDLAHHFAQAQIWAGNKLYKFNARQHTDNTPSPEPAIWNDIKFAAALQSRHTRAKKLIAITEDNRAQRQLAQSILRVQYDVVLAHHGVEALEIYNLCAPDMLFLDIEMPHMDGISVLKRILEHDANARIVMFSSQSSHDMLQHAIRIGAKGFVTKPFTADALLKYAHSTLSAA
jgi:two-component system, chemotaxis family, chemotaxis protein CheY